MVDPMSYNILEIYDNSLLDNIKKYRITFFGNILCKKRQKKGHYIFSYSNKVGITKILSYIKSIFHLISFVVLKKPKLIHFQWFKMPIIDIFLLFFLKARRIKIVFTAHNILPHNTRYRYYFQYLLIYFLAEKVIVHSENTKYELIKKFNIQSEKIYVVPMGLFFQKEISPIKMKENITISFLGSISEYKGIDLFIKSILNYRNKYKKIKFNIIGKGKIPNIEKIMKREDVYIINDFVSDLEFEKFLGSSDIVVLPYKMISQSAVLFSAIAYQIPCIVSDVGGISEPFDLFKIGWKIDINNGVNDLVNIYEVLEVHPEVLRQMRNDLNLWQTIFDYYSWENIGIKTEMVYNV